MSLSPTSFSPPSPRRTALAVALCLASLASPGRSQDDPDLSIGRGHSPVLRYDSRGDLVLAYVEDAVPYDNLVVQMSQDHGATWMPLYRGPLGLLPEIDHLSMDVASGYADPAIDRKVFLGVTGRWQDRGKWLGFYGLLSDFYDTPWTRPHCEWIYTSSGQAVPWSGMMTSVAVVPLQSPTDYAVGLALTFPRGTGMSVQIAWSTDHGRTASGGRVIAGSLGETIDDGSTFFGSPSLVGDVNTRETTLAFHDGRGKVYVLSELSREHIDRGKPLRRVFETSNGTFSNPRLAAAAGSYVFTCFSGTPHPSYGSHVLTLFEGNPAGGFLPVIDLATFDVVELHGFAMTPGDVMLRGSDARIAATCIVDPAPNSPGVGIFYIECSTGGSEITRTQINDHGVNNRTYPVPRVAATPRGAAGGSYETVVYPTEGAAMGDVWLDQ